MKKAKAKTLPVGMLDRDLRVKAAGRELHVYVRVDVGDPDAASLQQTEFFAAVEEFAKQLKAEGAKHVAREPEEEPA